MQQVQARQRLEALTHDVVQRALTYARVADLFAFGPGQEFGQVVDGQVLAHGQADRGAAQQAGQTHFFGFELDGRQGQWCHHQFHGGAKQLVVAIGRCRQHFLDAQSAAHAAQVFDHHFLAQALFVLSLNQTGDCI